MQIACLEHGTVTLPPGSEARTSADAPKTMTPVNTAATSFLKSFTIEHSSRCQLSVGQKYYYYYSENLVKHNRSSVIKIILSFRETKFWILCTIEMGGINRNQISHFAL